MGKLLEYRRQIFSILYVDYEEGRNDATIYYTKGGTENIADADKVTVKLTLWERLRGLSLLPKLLEKIDEIDDEIEEAERIYKRGKIG